ncbi:MAG: hypothetical protein GY745_16350 [Actinomycetia bacterium]|nr:hypothetical protein [Actinomycetes bacterium]MCP4086604.1 hypothetical protein [Actinomycetes bacterium]
MAIVDRWSWPHVPTGDMRPQLWRGVLVHVGALIAGLIVLLATLIFSRVVGVDGSFLTREPQVALDGKLYAGALSNLGAVIWMLAAVFAFVGWMTASDIDERRMFLAGGVIGSVLLADDFFLLHDWVSGRSQLVEYVMIGSYLVAVVVLVAVYRWQLGWLASAGIVLTLTLLGMSIVLDVFVNDLDQIVEDGFKFLGICTWAATWTLRAHPWTFREPLC